MPEVLTQSEINSLLDQGARDAKKSRQDNLLAFMDNLPPVDRDMYTAPSEKITRHASLGRTPRLREDNFMANDFGIAIHRDDTTYFSEPAFRRALMRNPVDLGPAFSHLIIRRLQGGRKG